MLIWKAIQEAKQHGMKALDMGRSDWDNPGLATFKDRWGALRSTMTYLRFGSQANDIVWTARNARVVAPIVKYIPDSIFAWAGAVLYRHAG